MAIDLNVLRSKLEYMKSRVTKRTVIREKRPGAQTKAGKLLSQLEQNAQSGKVEYSKSEVDALMDTYVKAQAKNLAFNRNDILLNKVNKNDQIYKFFFEDNGVYHFVTKESVQGKNIAITWSPSKINADITFKVGVNRSGTYHWDFSEVEKVLSGDSTTRPSEELSGAAKDEATSGENPSLHNSEDSSVVGLSTEARAEVTSDVPTLEHPKSDATQSSVQNLVDSNSDVQQRGSIQKELRKLKGLFDEGLIDEAEYKEMKLNVIRSSANSTTPPSASPQHLDDMGTRIHSSGSISTHPPPSIDELGTMVAGPNTLPPGLDAMGTMVGSADVETIGSYRILELLGQGGMGSVFKGRHINEQYAKALGDVAIKMIQPSLASDASFKSRFINEAIFGKKLSHPNIASVIDVVDDRGVLALLMDFVEGQELTELIPEGGMSVDEVLRLLKPIASALDYLHEQGIVHRDMKPANVRVKPDGTPVILDFGIAKDTNEADNGMTQTGTAMGTQTYMAPEQMDAKRVTGAADQYALSMMAYQMLSGTLPWDEGLSSVRVTMAKMTGDFKGLEDVDGASDSVNRMVMRGLSLNPEDRFDSCSEFVVEIERAPNDQQLVLEQQRLKEEQERIDQERLVKVKEEKEEKEEKQERLQAKRQADAERFELERLAVEAKKAEEQRLLAEREAEQLNADREALADLEAREDSSSVDSSSSGLKVVAGLLLLGCLGYGGYSFMGAGESAKELQGNGYTAKLISAGTFTMGCTSEQGDDCWQNEKLNHEVTISEDFYLMENEVTQALYERVMGENPSQFKGVNLPVESVSWYDAVKFCNKLSQIEGLDQCYTINETDVLWSNKSCGGWRLPTEAEWEYAARGGQSFKYAGSDNVDEVAWYGERETTGSSGSNWPIGSHHPVGQKKPNGFGLYDMSGNVSEWVWDWYGEYSSDPVVNPTGISSASDRVFRGGYWYTYPEDVRSAKRDGYPPTSRYYSLGFRLSRISP